jgi:hypothetical protein
MGESTSRFLDLLDLLVRHEVEFIVIGGVAAVLEGSPLTTFDLDILFDPTPGNIQRLLLALREINAHYKDPAGRRIEPDAERLHSMRMNLLKTDLGSLDVLRETCGFSYPDLVQRTNKHRVAELRVRALNLGALIEIKEKLDRPKDRFALIYLKRILDLKGS